MNIDIRKEEFLNLCEALEKGIITIEQFKILSDLENKSEMSALIHIMETTGLENKDILFENIIKEDNIEPICTILKKIFRKNAIYRTDIERQHFIFQVIVDNFNNALELSNLFSNDVIWNNKDFRDNIMFKLKLIPEENYESLREFNMKIKLLNSEVTKDKTLFLDEAYLSSVDSVFRIHKEDNVEDYLDCIRIESVRENQNFTKILEKVYKKYDEHVFGYYQVAYKLEEFDNKGKLSYLIDKVEEIVTSDLNGGEKYEKYINLFRNVINIDKEMIENFSDDNLKYLIDQAMIDEEFFETKEILNAVNEGKITLEEAKEIKKKLEKISWHNVRSMALYVYLDDKNLLCGEDFKKLANCSYDEAKIIITKLAIKKNNDKYKNEGLTYFGEKFSNNFVEYINKNELTKEELLEIRDKIRTSESKFIPSEKTFIIDTSSIVKEVESTKEEEKEEKNIKKIVKSRKSGIRFPWQKK